MDGEASYRGLTSDFEILEVEGEPIVCLELIVLESSAPGKLSPIRTPMLSYLVFCVLLQALIELFRGRPLLYFFYLKFQSVHEL